MQDISFLIEKKILFVFKKENKYIANYERIITVSVADGWIME